jgi:hypothetical protein
MSIPKFTGKESADEYLEWAEQCDQIFRVHNLSDQRCVKILLRLSSLDMLSLGGIKCRRINLI